MPAARNIAFLASDTALSEDAKTRLEARYGTYAPDEADVIVGAGRRRVHCCMTLHGTQHLNTPVLRHEPGAPWASLKNGLSPEDGLDRPGWNRPRKPRSIPCT